MQAAQTRGVKLWLLETRPHFLLLTPVCVLVGLAVAVYELESIAALQFVLAIVGALLAHISVNVLNDYFDFRSGLDLKTNRTPFSGGSGILPSGLLRSQQVYVFGMIALLTVAAIGGYFLYEFGWRILPLGVVGLVVVYFYTTHFTKNPLVCAIAPGLGFGPLMVLGVYFTQTGQYALAPALASLVPGFLVSNLLLLNQFPDAEADLTASRRHLPIALGKRTSARIYVGLLAAAYLSLVLTVAFGVLPLTALLGLLTLPLGLKAAKGVLKHYDDTGNLIPFMGINIQVTLLTPLLMGAGILLGMLL